MDAYRALFDGEVEEDDNATTGRTIKEYFGGTFHDHLTQEPQRSQGHQPRKHLKKEDTL